MLAPAVLVLGVIVSAETPVSEVRLTGRLTDAGSALVLSWNVCDPVPLVGLASPYQATDTLSPGLIVTLGGTWNVIDCPETVGAELRQFSEAAVVMSRIVTSLQFEL